MNSIEIQQEIELLNNQLSDLDSIERTPVKTAAEAIEQAEIVAQKEAKKGVLNTALSQLQSQLEEALRTEKNEKYWAALRKVDQYDSEAVEKLQSMANKFEEIRQEYADFIGWEKPIRKDIVNSLEEFRTEAHDFRDMGISTAGDLPSWSHFEFEKFFETIQIVSFMGRPRASRKQPTVIEFL